MADTSLEFMSSKKKTPDEIVQVDPESPDAEGTPDAEISETHNSKLLLSFILLKLHLFVSR